MFEGYGFQAAFVQIQAVLTLYSQGLLSGLVVDSGDGVTHAVGVGGQGEPGWGFEEREALALFEGRTLLCNKCSGPCGALHPCVLSTPALTCPPRPSQVPVVDGYSSAQLTRRLNMAGRHVTAYLLDLLRRRGYPLNRSADFDTVRQVGEGDGGGRYGGFGAEPPAQFSLLALRGTAPAHTSAFFERLCPVYGLVAGERGALLCGLRLPAGGQGAGPWA